MGLTIFCADHDHIVYSLHEETISSAVVCAAKALQEEEKEESGSGERKRERWRWSMAVSGLITQEERKEETRRETENNK